MKPILAVLCKDKEYCYRFSEVAQRQRDTLFKLYAFTGEQDLIKKASQEAIDVLLTEEGFFTEKVRQLHFSAVLFFSDIPGKEEPGKIYRYQSVSNILRDTMKQCKDLPFMVNLERFKTKKAKITGIFSPLGGAGCSSLAMSLGMLLSREEKTLLINLELCSGLENLLHCRFREGMTDLIYLIRSGRLKSGGQVLSLTEKIGELEYIPPFTSPEELLDVTAEEWIRLIGIILEYSDYTHVVIDLGQIHYRCPSVLEVCDQLVEVIKDDPISVAKRSEYDQFLERRGYGKVKERVFRITQNKEERNSIFDADPELLPYGGMGETAREVIEHFDLS